MICKVNPEISLTTTTGQATLDRDHFVKSILNNINGAAPAFSDCELAAAHPHVLLACFPKSGSTYLIKLLDNFLGFPHVPLCFSFGRSEQDLYLPSILYYDYTPTVSQQHLRATEANIDLIKAFKIKPILLVRNIFDTLVSLRDHFATGAIANKACYIDKRFQFLSPEEQMDWLVDLAAPWYIHFYVSWQNASHDLKPLWLTYDEVINKTSSMLTRIEIFLDIEKSSAERAAAIETTKNGFTRMNKGVAGRGVMMSDRQKAHIKRLCAYYPKIDFTPILA